MAKHRRKNWEENVLPSIKSICVKCSKTCKGEYPITGCGSLEYKLVLVSYSSKLNAVKQVHDILRIGLKEAKDLVDKCEENNEVVLTTGSSFGMKKLFNKFDQSCIQVKVVDL